MINGSIAKKLDVPLSRFAIRNMVMAKITEKEEFAESIENKPVFVKFDGVTRLRKHYLVFQVVEEAGIKREDVWACIVDNAAVMLKSIKLMNDKIQQEKETDLFFLT